MIIPQPDPIKVPIPQPEPKVKILNKRKGVIEVQPQPSPVLPSYEASEVSGSRGYLATQSAVLHKPVVSNDSDRNVNEIEARLAEAKLGYRKFLENSAKEVEADTLAGKKVDDLRQRIQAKAEEHQQLLAKTEKSLDTAKSDMERKAHIYQSKERDMLTKQSKLQAQLNEVGNSPARVKELETQLATVQAEAHIYAQEQAGEFQTRFAEASKHNEELIARNQELSRSNFDIQGKHDAIAGIHGNLQADANTLRQKNEQGNIAYANLINEGTAMKQNFEQRIAQLEAEKTELIKGGISEKYQAEREATEKAERRFHDDVKSATDALEVQRQRADQAVKDAANLKARTETERADKTNAQAHALRMEAKYKEDKVHLESAIATQAKEFELKAAQLETQARSERSGHSKELEAKTAEQEKLKEELASLGGELDKQKALVLTADLKASSAKEWAHKTVNEKEEELKVNLDIFQKQSEAEIAQRDKTIRELQHALAENARAAKIEKENAVNATRKEESQISNNRLAALKGQGSWIKQQLILTEHGLSLANRENQELAENLAHVKKMQKRGVSTEQKLASVRATFNEERTEKEKRLSADVIRQRARLDSIEHDLQGATPSQLRQAKKQAEDNLILTQQALEGVQKVNKLYAAAIKNANEQVKLGRDKLQTAKTVEEELQREREEVRRLKQAHDKLALDNTLLHLGRSMGVKTKEPEPAPKLYEVVPQKSTHTFEKVGEQKEAERKKATTSKRKKIGSSDLRRAVET